MQNNTATDTNTNTQTKTKIEFPEKDPIEQYSVDNTEKYKSSKQKNTQNKKLNVKTKVIIAISSIIVLIAVLFGIYAIIAQQYEDTFLPNTNAQGLDISKMTVEEANDAVSSQMNSLEINIQDPDGENTIITGEDLNMRIDSQVLTDLKNSQSKWDWLSALTSSEDVVVDTLYDEDKIDGIIETLACVSDERTSPVNATIEYNSDEEEFQAIGAQAGNKANKEELIAIIKVKAQNGGGDVDVSQTYEQPQWTEDSPEIATALTKLNGYINKDITYNIDMIEKAEKLTKNQIATFLTVDANNPEEIVIGFNDDAITEWLRELGKEYDTVGNEKTYTTAYGKTVTVAGGTYGWITDEKSMLPIVKDNIFSSEDTVNQDFVYQKEALGPKGDGLSELGKNGYCDVDKSEQVVRYVDENGNILFTADVVTGSANAKNDTPVGFWDILDRKTDYIMDGEPDPVTGKPIYRAHTDLFLRITWSGHAFHEYDSRWDWSKDAWLRGNGSHGCVNMHGSDVWELDKLVHIGTPVIIHD